jgi:hypothetical protein
MRPPSVTATSNMPNKQWTESEYQTKTLLTITPMLFPVLIVIVGIREGRGIKNTQPVVDEFALLWHIKPDAPPMLLITDDRKLEMIGRYDENAYLHRMMKIVGHKNTVLYELDGYDHEMTAPAFPLLVRFVNRQERNCVLDKVFTGVCVR